VVGSHTIGLPRALALTGVTLTGLALVAGAYFWRVKVVVATEEVTVYGMSGRVRRWPRAAVQGCTLVSVFLAVRPTLLIVAYNDKHQALFTLSGNFWDEASLRTLTHELGYSHRSTRRFATLTKDELLTRYPGALSFADRHPYLVAVPVGLLIPITVIAVALALQSL
jgi:hypothetical protein